MKLQSKETDSKLLELFKALDSDGDKFLTKDELKAGINKFLGKS